MAAPMPSPPTGAPIGAWPVPVVAPSAPPPPRIHRWIYPVAALGVVAVLILVGLVVGGIGPFAPAGASSGDNPTFSEAASIAERTAQSYGSGSWSLIYAAGVVLAANFSTAVDISSMLASIPTTECSVSATTDFPTAINQSASTANRSSGGAPIWGFLLRNSNGSGLVVWVHNGIGEPLLSLSGGICATVLALIQPIPSGAADSPVVARAALNAGGYGFLRAHPNANMTMTVHGGITLSLTASEPSNWSVTLETCSLNATSTSQDSGALFTAQLGVTTGAVIGTPLTNDTGCSSLAELPIGASGTLPGGSSGSTPIGTALAIGSFESGREGTGPTASYFDNGTVESSSGNLWWSNVSFEVIDPSTGPVTGPVNVTITGITGCTAAIYSFVSGTFEAVPPVSECANDGFAFESPVTSGEQLHLYSTTNLAGQGDELEIFGNFPAYSGDIAYFLP